MNRTSPGLATAMDSARRTVTSAMNAASDIESLVRLNPDLAGELAPAADRLYTLADAARDIEHDLAAAHARRREGAH